MKLLVSYWLIGVNDYPENTIVHVKESSLDDKVIKKIKTIIVEDSGENIEVEDVTIINVIKLDK